MAVSSVRSVRTKENPMNIEDLLRKAIAAEAKASRKNSKDIARVWALTYADAAVALFERLRIDSGVTCQKVTLVTLVTALYI
jgi:hypothetical protein